MGNGMANLKKETRTVAGVGLLTAVIIVLQMLAIALRPTGFFNITLSLVPILIGAALYGWKSGAWLGFVFSIVVLFTDAGAFLAVSIPGTIITVIAKGTLCGIAAGLVYKLIEKKSTVVAVITAAIISPCVNTGIFLLGCIVFFMNTINEWAAAFGYESAGKYMIFGLAGVNFIIEMAVNIVLSSAVIMIIKAAKRGK